MARVPRRPARGSRRPPASYRRPIATRTHTRTHTHPDTHLYRQSQPLEATKTLWDKASVVIQAFGALGILVSLIGLAVTVHEFDVQQTSNAAQALDQQRQDTLNEYLDDMSALVLQYGLTTSKPNSPTRAIAVARTLTAVRNLDGSRKATIIRYLWEAGLLTGPQPIVNINGADLNLVVFTNVVLKGVDLVKLALNYAQINGAQLAAADLSGSALFDATMIGANLTSANLTYSDPIGASLTDATLTRANLRYADLDGADFAGATLTGADLKDATYNSKPEYDKNLLGQLVIERPTQWPRGFDPRAAGAICWDCGVK